VSTKFRLLAESDQPTVIGKAWWNEALTLTAAGDGRRLVMWTIGLTSVPLALAFCVKPVISADTEWTQTMHSNALETQRAHGWSFGMAGAARTLRFTERVDDPQARARMATLAADLTPTNPEHVPVAVPTLFQSLTERPSRPVVTEDLEGVSQSVALADVMVPISTKAMQAAQVDARWLRGVLAGRLAGLAVVVDLPGPESVAFAAELADAFDPVFLFDNWPHPLGVVPAHLTLAAALALQPRFIEMRGLRSTSAPPLFVLDRARLNPYTDEATQFDNRSLARVPTATWFRSRGISRLFYVAPNGVTVLESDDLTDDFIALAAQAIDVRTLQLADFYGAATTEEARAAFNARYAFPSTPPPPPAAPTMASSWRPTPRRSTFSTGTGMGNARVIPAGFGTVPLVVGTGGAILGAVYYRNGSWNRTTSSSWSGGG
jgi:hypothetical protein